MVKEVLQIFMSVTYLTGYIDVSSKMFDRAIKVWWKIIFKVYSAEKSMQSAELISEKKPLPSRSAVLFPWLNHVCAAPQQQPVCLV